MKTRKILAILLVLAMVLSVPVAASAAEGYTASLNVNWWDYSTQTITGAGTYTLTADLNWDGTVEYAAITIPDAYTALSGCSATMTVTLGDQVLYDGWVGLNAQWVDDGNGNYVQSNNCYIELFASWNGTNLVESIPTGGIMTVTLNITGELTGGSEETPEEPEKPASTYVVAGTSGLCGSEWNAVDTANRMSDEDGDGVYTITYTGVAPGSYEFKVVENLSDGTQNWYGDSNWNNVVLNVNAKCDVTISFDTASQTVSCAISNAEVEDDGTKYIVAGVSELCGSYWDPSDAANQMTDEDGDGIYTITYANVAPGNYEYKIVANLPDGTQNWLSVDGSNVVVSVAEACDVTISYNAANGAITATGSGVNTETTVDSYILAGMASLCGSDWNVTDVNNQMTDEDGDGIYSITYNNVMPGWYEYKVVENLSNGTRNWLTNEPNGNNMVLNLTKASNVTITYNTATAEIKVEEDDIVYTAYLCYGDADWWPSAAIDSATPVTVGVSGDGNYTMVWDVPGTSWGATAEGMSVFYIDIVGAYTALKNNVVTNVSVKVDGEEVPVDMNNVKVYESDGSYRIELYNMYGGSASAVPTDLVINETLTVVFTLGTGNASTGDSTNLVLLCGTMLVTAMGIVALVVARKKFF